MTYVLKAALVAGIALAIAMGSVMIILVTTGKVRGQDHQHPPQDAEIHDKFYATWQVPNGREPRQSSCCDKRDCFPTTFKRIGGVLHAQRNGRFEPFPESLLEENQEDPRESPDGRSHACYNGGRWLCGARGGAG